MILAMAKEWSKWVQFSATKKLSKPDLQALMARHKHIRPVNTRWVLTFKEDETCKARLVVVGCQEPRGQIRSDSPTGSQLAFHITIWLATQKRRDKFHFTRSGFTAQSASTLTGLAGP